MVDSDRLGHDITSELSQKVVKHRDEFYHFFIGRYMEALVNMFKYNISVFDKAKLELALREGYGVVFGKNKNGTNVILGYINSSMYQFNSPNMLLRRRRYTGSDINFIIPNELLPERAKTKNFLEIWENDGGNTGDFVVFWNKQINLTNDLSIIEHYASELAEIVASRFSLVMQAKIQTVLTGEPDDQTINQMIASIYNGNPFIRTAQSFDIDDSILTINNTNLANNLAQLKIEYQNKISELNSLFGVNVLAIDKASGVTTSEANGNLGYVTINGEIWLSSRRKALNLYNHRFNTDYRVTLNDSVGGALS